MLHIDIPEQKQAAPPAPSVQAATKQHLRHLKGFAPKDLQDFKITYKKSLRDLDQLVDTHKKVRWFIHGNYAIANYGSCLIYLIFPIETSNTGIDATAHEVKPSARVPSGVGYGIGGPLSVIDDIYYMAVFSVRKEAVKTTLYFASLPPWRQIRSDLWRYVKEHPGQVSQEALKILAHQAILQPVNLTSTITELIYYPLDFTSWQARLATGVTLFYGDLYYKMYTNPDWYEGVGFWQNPLNRPWLFKDLWQGRFATALQVWLQGASAVGLRVFPLNYYIAKTAQQTLGIWFPPYYVAAATFLHALATRYPASYERYLSSRERVFKILHASPEIRQEAEATLLSEGVPLTDENLKEARERIIWMRHDLYKKNMLKDGWPFFLIKNAKLASLQPLVCSLLGSYFGYGLAGQLASLMPGWLALTLGIPLGTLTFAGIPYKAEVERIAWERRLKTLPPLPPPPRPAELAAAENKAEDEIAGEENADEVVDVANLPEMEEAPRSLIPISAAVILNVSGSLVGAESIVGTMQDLTDDDSPEATTTITLLALQMAYNAFLFNHERLCDTMEDIYESLPSRANVSAWFFSHCCCGCCPRCCRRLAQQQQPATPPPEQKKEAPPRSSWAFWRKSSPAQAQPPEQKKPAPSVKAEPGTAPSPNQH